MVRRNLAPLLAAALADTPVVLLHGARQVGKTTLARSTAAAGARRYITLDDSTVLAAALADPDSFIAGIEGPVVIDEVQRAPELLRAIKASVDRVRAPGRFLLTGSANVMLLPRIAESLAGRMEIITLWPLSQGELNNRRESFIEAVFSAHPARKLRAADSGTPIATRLVRGGFPEASSRADEPRRQAWFASYVTSVLQRDVRDVSRIENLTALPRLLSLLAARTSGMLSAADISRTLGVPASTLGRYLTLLEATFLTAPVPAWTANIGLRLVKAPKVTLCDTGLAAALLGADRARVASDPHLLGQLLENFVIMELRKQSGWSAPRASIHHFRTHNGLEVDIVLEAADGRIVGVEVKSGSTVNNGDFRGMRELAEQCGPRFAGGYVLHGGEELVAFGKGFWAAPLSCLWGTSDPSEH